MPASETDILASRLYCQGVGEVIRLPGGVTIEHTSDGAWVFRVGEESVGAASPEEAAQGALRLARKLAKPNAN
jgi:hypothetical protein